METINEINETKIKRGRKPSTKTAEEKKEIEKQYNKEYYLKHPHNTKETRLCICCNGYFNSSNYTKHLNSVKHKKNVEIYNLKNEHENLKTNLKKLFL